MGTVNGGQKILLPTVCLKIASFYKLNRHGDSTHPCLTLLSISISFNDQYSMWTEEAFVSNTGL